VTLLQKLVEKTVRFIGIGNNFLNRTPVAQDPRDRIYKWNCIKLKTFCTTKKTALRLNRQPTYI
jgi:hypothetical protein